MLDCESEAVMDMRLHLKNSQFDGDYLKCLLREGIINELSKEELLREYKIFVIVLI